MKVERPRKASGESRAILTALFAVLLASCSTSDTSIQLASPAYNMAVYPVTAGQSLGSGEQSPAFAGEAAPMPSGEAALPAQVALLPTDNPANAGPSAHAQGDATPLAQSEVVVAALAPEQSPNQPAEAVAAAASEAPVPAAGAEATTAAVPIPAPRLAAEDAAGSAPQEVASAAPPAPTAPVSAKKRSFLSSFFGKANAEPARPKSPEIFRQVVTNPPPPEQADQPETKKAEPLIQLASLTPTETKPLIDRTPNDNALPGVRQTALFEIKRKSGLDDDSDVDLHEEDAGPVRLASAAGLARLAPNGLRTQTGEVDVACLKPSLVRELKRIEQHFGRKVVVTSGYRSPSHNRRARGAKNSLHMYCAAADIQVDGVSKWELASFVRSMPGRGGVGTYCHTDSVHIDVGPERDWNWRCRRR